MSVWTDLGKQVGALTDNKNAKLALSAFIISTLVIAVLLSIFSLRYDAGKLTFAVPDSYATWFGIIYILLFIAGWFILYLLNTKDNTDVYSEVREKLKGGWIVTFEANHGPTSNQAIVPQRVVACKIEINQVEKLEISFNITKNPMFEDDASSRIKDIGIRYGDDGGYVMFYYYKATRKLQTHIAKDILAENNNADRDQVEVEVFGRITFDKPTDGGIIDKMTGHWYDLNGNTSRLYAFLDQRTIAEVKKKPFEPMQLSQVPIHERYFDSDMGVVTFTR